jgi:alpha-beta hydrolase superfamily lysophospholipase
MRGTSLATLAFVALCSTFFITTPSAFATKVSATPWVDQKVSFTSQGMKIYATFRHPKHAARTVPGVLLIAGSGPTNRNGNTPLEAGPVDTLKTLADWLSDDGVASLRFDKLGSGETGLGTYAADPASIGVAVYEQESRSALKFLAQQKGINDEDLGVFGHSEGALFALLLATEHAGSTPPIHALGLFEPLSNRYLDLITIQVYASLQAQVKSGAITKSLETTVLHILAKAVVRLLTQGTVKANLPYGLANILNPADAMFLAQAQQFDPAVLASDVAPETPVLLTCSNDDIQVTCGEVDRLARGFKESSSRLNFVHLVGVDHVLKVDASLTGADYGKQLPFSPQLRIALQAFVAKYL